MLSLKVTKDQYYDNNYHYKVQSFVYNLIRNTDFHYLHNLAGRPCSDKTIPPRFKEFFYRRNIVVHNYGFPDSTYIAKTKFKGDKNYWLEIDKRYINEAFSIFESYAKKIAHFFDQKYGYLP